MRRLPFSLFVPSAVVLTGCGSDETRTSPTTEPVSEGGCSGIACAVTANSGLFGIPTPADATPVGSTGLSATKAGTLEEASTFCYDFLTDSGWTFAAEYSSLDPEESARKGLGHVSNGVYCRIGDGLEAVSVIVGDQGAQPGTVEFSVMSLPDEETCP